MFDFNDVARKQKMESTETDVEEWNIGKIREPKMIKLSKTLPPHIKQKYIELWKNFKDDFEKGKDDLKPYDTNIIQNRIPPKENHKPFRQIVSVRKKTGGFMLWIDFRNLNTPFPKESFPLPKINHTLQWMLG